MCVVLDADVLFEVFGDDRPPAGKAFFDWIDQGRVRLICGGKLLEELAKRENFKVWWREALLAGRATSVDNKAVERETNRLIEENSGQSNDKHVLALALVGGARLLYTNDTNLRDDFKNPSLINNPRGKIYSTRVSSAFSSSKRKLLATSSCRPT